MIKFFVSISALLLIHPLWGQGQVNIQTPIPNEPTAAALGEYGEVPVSLHTGVPNISIPIFEVKGKKLSLPISLSYHAGGIKVEEVASWVGLGWSLQAGE